MCRIAPNSSDKGEKIDSSKINSSGSDENNASKTTESQPILSQSKQTTTMRRRRRKTDKQSKWSKELAKLEASTSTSSTHNKRIVKKKKKTKMTAKHQNDSQSGGMDALIPSLIGVVVLIVVVMAKMGFRGRATVAGIDLGTTNSVVCVQAPSSGVGEIVCVPDPATNSPVVPS
eukprot:scaffold6031_cov137-Skeletonema_marinoi.AAC.9